MRVLIIPEDQIHDRYIVQPVVEGIFADLERTASVSVLPEPRLRGAEDALDPELIADIVRDNRQMTELFLLIVDRDCDRHSHTDKVHAMEERHPDVLLGCLAFEEIETWMLALHRKDVEQRGKTTWPRIRAHCDPKEEFAQPLLEKLGDKGPGGGRKAAMRAVRTQWRTLCSLCDEIAALRNRIATHLAP